MTPPVKPIKSISRQTLLKPEGHNRGHLQQNLELQNEKTKEAPITAELKVSKIEKPTPPVNVSLSKGPFNYNYLILIGENKFRDCRL